MQRRSGKSDKTQPPQKNSCGGSGCRKSPTGLFDRFLQSAARIICPPVANKFHTCSLISIFAQVHAPVENGFDFIRRYGGELCEALF